MRKFILAAGLALVTTGAQALTFETYAGAVMGPGQLDYGPLPPSSPNTLNMDNGFAAGGGAYFDIPGGFEVGFDVMSTSRTYSAGQETLSTVSGMLAGRMELPNISSLNATPYFGIGVGAINVTYNDPSTAFLNGSDLVGGYQLEIGARISITPAMTGFTALKYQGTFSDPVIQTEYVEYESLSLIGGVRW